MRFLYDIVFFIFSLFYLPFFFIKGKHRKGFRQRFGVVSDEVRRSLTGKTVIWIHAVSVGEMNLAVRLADAIKKRSAGMQLVLTATTAAGKEIAEKFKKTEDIALYFPADFRASVRSFVESVNPKAAIILETEIWPNLLHELSERKVPVFILNGRISDRAWPKYRTMRFFLRPSLNCLAWVGAQDQRMQARFLELGVDPGRVAVTGNMKYDWMPPVLRDGEIEKIEKCIKPSGSMLCIAGSTHEGEEEQLLEVYKAVQAKHASFKLLIAPRHMERLESIEAEAYRKDLACQRVSAVLRLGQPPVGNRSVFLLDKIGILASLYRIADFVFIGGSLLPFGGHNLIEPAFYEKPVVCGHFMENFKEMVREFKKAEAIAEVQDQEALKVVFNRLLEEPSYRQKLGVAAKQMIALHQGATERNIQEVLKHLNR